ncbi:MAG: M23 family metallopeptidase [Bacillota bacterium]|nr:M23 family metallopeptidase [Bacillota bacterium]
MAAYRRRGGVRGPIHTRLAPRGEMEWLKRNAATVAKQAAVALFIFGLVVYVLGVGPPYWPLVERAARYAASADYTYAEVVDGILGLKDMSLPRSLPEAKALILRWWTGRDPLEAGGIEWSLLAPASGAISSPFGWRTHPVHKDLRYHTGVDIAAPEGSDVLAAREGQVLAVGDDELWGINVSIQHAGDQVTFYAHLAQALVAKDQQVVRGQVIGKVGRTGSVVDAHLHFELRQKGEPIDPEPLIRAAGGGT